MPVSRVCIRMRRRINAARRLYRSTHGSAISFRLLENRASLPFPFFTPSSLTDVRYALQRAYAYTKTHRYYPRVYIYMYDSSRSYGREGTSHRDVYAYVCVRAARARARENVTFACICVRRATQAGVHRAQTAELRLRAELLGNPRRAPLPLAELHSPAVRAWSIVGRTNAGFTRSGNEESPIFFFHDSDDSVGKYIYSFAQVCFEIDLFFSFYSNVCAYILTKNPNPQVLLRIKNI